MIHETAFPVQSVYIEDQDTNSRGMTLRDYFAAKAMQGMLSACTGWSESDQERLAKCSYKMADEMMKARNK